MRSVVLCAAILAGSAAQAQDFFIYGGAALEYERQPDGKGSDDKKDINGYIEIEKARIYFGVWAELSNQSLTNKADVYVGYRSEIASGLTYDISATRRFYLNDEGDYTSLDLGLGMPFGDKLSGTLDLTWYPASQVGDAYVGLSYDVTDKLSVSANYGTYGVEDASSEQEWDFGAGYALGDETAVDVRYYDGTEYVDPYLGVSLTWDTTLLSR
jgi:hypothetical protein